MPPRAVSEAVDTCVWKDCLGLSLEPVSKHRTAESSLLSWRFLLQGAAERQEVGRASGVKGEGRE